MRFEVDVRQVVFDPEDLGGDAGGYQRAGEHLCKTVAVIGFDLLNFILSAGINAVQDSLAERAAVFVHRNTIAAQGGQAHALDLCRIQAGSFQQQARDLTNIAPPNCFCIMLVPAGARIFQSMLLRSLAEDAAVLVD